jgi:hypothetical protein
MKEKSRKNEIVFFALVVIFILAVMVFIANLNFYLQCKYTGKIIESVCTAGRNRYGTCYKPEIKIEHPEWCLNSTFIGRR